MEVISDSELENLKLVHDVYAVTHQILTQRVQFHHDEFDFIKKVAAFHLEQMKEIRKKLEDFEASNKAKEVKPDGEPEGKV